MTDFLKKTYSLENGPHHIPIDDYVDSCNWQFSELLSRNPSEPEVQDFLETHPCLLPVGSTPGSALYPLYCGLIRQPTLPGQKSYVPDFMWIASHSLAWFPTLIEIEKPSKRVFNKDGNPSSDFTHARHQLAQWRSWFADLANVQQFIDLYGIPDQMRRRTMHLRMILIYGRRSEFERNPLLSRERGSLLPGHDEELMSFDRLRADKSMEDAITIKATGFGRYEAVSIPPVFEIGPEVSERLLHIDGIAEAIDRNPEISQNRKEFLKRRLPYWKAWARSPSGNLYSANDRE